MREGDDRRRLTLDEAAEVIEDHSESIAKRLNLGEWTLTFVMVDDDTKYKESGHAIGCEVYVTGENRMASVFIYPHQYEDKEALERSLQHELIHVLLYDYAHFADELAAEHGEFAEEVVQYQEELLVERIRKIVFEHPCQQTWQKMVANA